MSLNFSLSISLSEHADLFGNYIFSLQTGFVVCARSQRVYADLRIVVNHASPKSKAQICLHLYTHTQLLPVALNTCACKTFFLGEGRNSASIFTYSTPYNGASFFDNPSCLLTFFAHWKWENYFFIWVNNKHTHTKVSPINSSQFLWQCHSLTFAPSPTPYTFFCCKSKLRHLSINYY